MPPRFFFAATVTLLSILEFLPLKSASSALTEALLAIDACYYIPVLIVAMMADGAMDSQPERACQQQRRGVCRPPAAL